MMDWRAVKLNPPRAQVIHISHAQKMSTPSELERTYRTSIKRINLWAFALFGLMDFQARYIILHKKIQQKDVRCQLKSLKRTMSFFTIRLVLLCLLYMPALLGVVVHGQGTLAIALWVFELQKWCMFSHIFNSTFPWLPNKTKT